MTVTKNVTRIKLSAEEKNTLEEALEILSNVNIIIDNDIRKNYIVDSADLVLYNRIFSDIGRIEDYIMMEE